MNIVMILAGGSGQRLDDNIAKQYIEIDGRQIIEYTIEAFNRSPFVDDILIVLNRADETEKERLRACSKKIIGLIEGGQSRILSVQNGVKYLSDAKYRDAKIIISDAVRPCITRQEILSIIQKLDTCDAVTTGLESYETIIKAEKECLIDIIKRDGIYRQTSPEGYHLALLSKLYLDTPEDVIASYHNIGIDQLYARHYQIGIVKSTPLNFKITTRYDLLLFKAIVDYGYEKALDEILIIEDIIKD